jgi:phage-related holin
MKTLFYSLFLDLCTPFKSIIKVFTHQDTLTASAGLGLLITTIKAAFIRDHVVSWDLVTGLLTLLMVDTFLGVWKHAKRGSLSSSGFGKFAGKVIIYWLFVKVVDKIAGATLLSWTGDVMISALMVREAISIFENIAYLYPELVPKWILRKLKDFDEAGPIMTGDSTKIKKDLKK